jgi:hypothetical protein
MCVCVSVYIHVRAHMCVDGRETQDTAEMYPVPADSKYQVSASRSTYAMRSRTLIARSVARIVHS